MLDAWPPDPQAHRTEQPEPSDEVVGRLVVAIRQLDQSTSLTAILDIVAVHAARETPRSALYVVHEGRLCGWLHAGFASDGVSRTVDPVVHEASLLSRVIRTRTTSMTTENGEVVEFAAPLIVGGEVVAVLYADERRSTTTNADESSAVHRAWPGILEALVSHAARCLENVTLSRLLGEEPGASIDGRAGESDAYAPRPPADAIVLSDQKEAARRYARLLISEIRLYHETEIAAGRRHGDLGARLGPEIARARQLYQARIQPDVPLRDDYFEEELIRTLADGDSTLLHP